MPNMDDIAFFESTSYEHRGGIWPDACRRKRPTPFAGTSPPTLASDEGQEFPSIEVAPSPPRTHSAEELPFENDMSLQETTPTKRPATTSSAEHTSNILEDEDDPWFSDVKERDDKGPPDEERLSGGADLELRTSRPESENGDRQTGRSNAQQTFDSFLSPHTIRRSTSQMSLPSVSHRQESHATPGAEEHFSSSSAWASGAPSTPSHHKPSRSIGNSPPNPQSFLATLKARAGDKEALSKTAKETMRKWGVNWSGLKRDGQGLQDRGDDDGAAFLRTQTELGGMLAQKARAGLAEMRAAVVEWKERDRESRSGSDGSWRSPSSSPIPANATKDENRATTESPSSPALNADNGGRRSSLTESLSSDIGQARLVAPSLSRRPSSRRSEGRKEFQSDDPSNFASSPPTAIYTQQPLQAKTMTIPGIHASHRGEVMSMGYAPPASTPASAESKTKSPAIKSVYRLWKNSSSSQPPTISWENEGPRSGDPSDSGEGGDSETAVEETTRSVAHDSSPPLSRRSTGVNATHPEAEPTSESLETSAADEEDRARSADRSVHRPIDMVTDPGAHPGPDTNALLPPPLPPRKTSVPR
jgi:hypothetical protein